MLLFAESICRICVLLSSRVFLHLDGFGWTFVTFSGLEWSTYKPREDRFHSTLPLTYIRKTMEHQHNIQPKHGLCADIICGDTGYLRTTFHLQFPTFLHSICAAETSKPLISIRL